VSPSEICGVTQYPFIPMIGHIWDDSPVVRRRFARRVWKHQQSPSHTTRPFIILLIFWLSRDRPQRDPRGRDASLCFAFQYHRIPPDIPKTSQYTMHQKKSNHAIYWVRRKYVLVLGPWWQEGHMFPRVVTAYVGSSIAYSHFTHRKQTAW
jgi:hypothetical protein